MFWEGLHRFGLVAFLAFACYCIFYNSTTQEQLSEPPQSAGVYLTHEQYDRMQYRITDMEAALAKNGLPIPGSRVPAERPERPTRPGR